MRIFALASENHGSIRIANSAAREQPRNSVPSAGKAPCSNGSITGSQRQRHKNGIAGYSLLEILAVMMILGILAALALPRFAGINADADRNACDANKGNIEIQVQLWYRSHHAWPASDLRDIGSDLSYFPDGLPTCPVDGSPYTIGADGLVLGHDH